MGEMSWCVVAGVSVLQVVALLAPLAHLVCAQSIPPIIHLYQNKSYTIENTTVLVEAFRKTPVNDTLATLLQNGCNTNSDAAEKEEQKDDLKIELRILENNFDLIINDITSLNITYVDYHLYEKESPRKLACITINGPQNQTNKGSKLQLNLQPMALYRKAAFKFHWQSSSGLSTKTIFLVKPEGLRFVYNDATAPEFDWLTIAEVTANKPEEYHIQSLQIEEVEYQNNNDSWETVKIITETNRHVVNISDIKGTRFYRIISQPRNFRTELALGTISASILLTAAVCFCLWYMSIPKKKTITVIYCQCPQHARFADPLKQLLLFMEKYCYMQVEELSGESVETPTEGEILIGSKSKPDLIIFVPLPAIANHDRLYEAQVHQICDRYKTTAHKVELLLPRDDATQVCSPCSDWPRNSYTDFKLFEELPQFVRYSHPCYYPSCLERIFRKSLWAPRLERLLKSKTFTNDHMREVTDPKFYPPYTPVEIHFPLPDLDLTL